MDIVCTKKNNCLQICNKYSVFTNKDSINLKKIIGKELYIDLKGIVDKMKKKN